MLLFCSVINRKVISSCSRNSGPSKSYFDTNIIIIKFKCLFGTCTAILTFN